MHVEHLDEVRGGRERIRDYTVVVEAERRADLSGLLGQENLTAKRRAIVQRREAAEGESISGRRLTNLDLGCHGGLLGSR
jgi:hypothetical protein